MSTQQISFKNMNSSANPFRMISKIFIFFSLGRLSAAALLAGGIKYHTSSHTRLCCFHHSKMNSIRITRPSVGTNGGIIKQRCFGGPSASKRESNTLCRIDDAAEASPSAFRLGMSKRSDEDPIWHPKNNPFNIYEISGAGDFIDFLSEEEETINVVRFQATWCRACKRFDLRYHKLLHDYLGEDHFANKTSVAVRFADVDFDKNHNLCDTLGVTRLPHVQMYRKKAADSGGEDDGPKRLCAFSCEPEMYHKVTDKLHYFLYEE
uniref:Thioredoxin domain-containing protein n=1 Tax=Ditylum brightwellii TaxID=49249 RepID=A0A7S4UFB6_9STRA